MKTLFILFLTITFSFSDNLLYLEQEKNKGVQTYCIDDDYYYNRNIFYFYDLKSNRERSLNTQLYSKIVITGGWELDTYNNCIFDESNYYGLTYEEYHYLMALYGVVLSLLIGFGLIVAVL